MIDEESDKITLDLSNKQLKKVPKSEEAQNVRTLILDENELQKIDNIDSYLKIETLSLSKNQLLRMYGVCRLHCLRELNLSFNGILSIEGLKDCIHLRHLNLEGNNIKTIEHLNQNINLEHLNLAENSIGSISDISFLKNLKELLLHGNRLTHLRQCDKYLPSSLETLTLAKNNIADLNEISALTQLRNLHSLAISENPCVSMTNGTDGFDYRPFVLNWCMSVKVIDGFMVDPIESLKAEWLYSQGRGRQFRLGEQAALAKHLSLVCPLTGKALENENERKLRLILSKAQQHQRQLQEEISENSTTSSNNSPSSGRRKASSRLQSPRFSRLTGRQGSPESMISSYHGTSSEHAANLNHLGQMTTSLIENIKNDSLMSQSFDGGSSVHSNSSTTAGISTKANNSQESTPRTITPNPYNEQSFVTQPSGGPLTAASKMVPVPETLMSPDVCPAAVAQRVTVSAISTQLQAATTKIAKNKDNKLSSPKTRSPHLKRQHVSACSPQKSNLTCNNKIQQRQQHSNRISSSENNNMAKSGVINSSNSVHIAAIPPPDDDADDEENLLQHHQNHHNRKVDEHFSSDEDSDNINVDKLKTIRNKAAQRQQIQQHLKDNSSAKSQPAQGRTENSAVVIQKIWRGYRTRKKTKDIAEKLLKKRTNEYIDKLTKDMEMTKAQLENERKIQQLQMQAINALWKKVSTMQSSGDNVDNSQANDPNKSAPLSLDNSSTSVVTDLAKTCCLLTNQVQQLQGSMRDILNCLALFCNLPQENVKKLLAAGVADALSTSSTATSGNEKRDTAATQTEIVAVHTPQIESQNNFPFTKVRPSTLPLAADAKNVAKNATTILTIEEQPEHCDQIIETNSLNESGVISEDVCSVAGTESCNEKTDEDEKEQASARE